MLAFLATALGKYILGGTAIAVALIGAWFKAKASGVAKERARQAEADRKARDISDDIDDAVAGRSAGANREELRTWAKH